MRKRPAHAGLFVLQAKPGAFAFRNAYPLSCSQKNVIAPDLQICNNTGSTIKRPECNHIQGVHYFI